MTQSRLMLTRYKNGILSMIINDNKTEAVSYYSDSSTAHIGDIYVAKVLNVVQNINAAFIDYQKGKRGYLPISGDLKPVLLNRAYDGRILSGDEILVQYEKEAIRSKEPVFTMNLSLAGKYCVITNANSTKGVSTKVGKQYRASLYELIPTDTQYGVIIRTSAESIVANNENPSCISSECITLIEEMDALLKKGIHRTCFSKIYSTTPEYLSDIRDKFYLKHDFEKIVCDDKEVFDELQAYADKYMPKLCPKLSLYNDKDYPLSKLYSVETRLSELLNKKVWLKSGAYLVIEQTEAMYVIDVNSGKNTSKKNNSEYIYSINLEAADEIMRQLRLRNLSGMIIVDFINMESSELTNKLMQELGKLAKADPIKTNIVDITGLGLVEITRKKTKKSLKSQLEEAFV